MISILCDHYECENFFGRKYIILIIVIQVNWQNLGCQTTQPVPIFLSLNNSITFWWPTITWQMWNDWSRNIYECRWISIVIDNVFFFLTLKSCCKKTSKTAQSTISSRHNLSGNLSTTEIQPRMYFSLVFSYLNTFSSYHLWKK